MKKESLWRGIEPRSPACILLTGGYTNHYTTKDVRTPHVEAILVVVGDRTLKAFFGD